MADQQSARIGGGLALEACVVQPTPDVIARRIVQPEILAELSLVWPARGQSAAVGRVVDTIRRCATENGWLPAQTSTARKRNGDSERPPASHLTDQGCRSMASTGAVDIGAGGVVQDNGLASESESVRSGRRARGALASAPLEGRRCGGRRGSTMSGPM